MPPRTADQTAFDDPVQRRNADEAGGDKGAEAPPKNGERQPGRGQHQRRRGGHYADQEGHQYLVHAASLRHPTRQGDQPAIGHAADDTGNNHDGINLPRGRIGKSQRHPTAADCTQDDLPVGADVQDVGA